MTVVESIEKWLKDNKIVLDNISVDMLPYGISSLAFMKSPTNLVESFIDGSQKRTEYYTLYVRRPSQFEDERDENAEYFEDIEYKVAELNREGILPSMDKNRFCDSVSISGTAYLFQTQENESIYSLTFEIVYRKEA